jgi:hypothetical protein
VPPGRGVRFRTQARKDGVRFPPTRNLYACMNTGRLIIVIGVALLVAIVVVLRGM